jgi:transposase InsO family protein
MACNTQFPEGVAAKHKNLFLISDNGSQPTSRNYMNACSILTITQIFASYNNPKGNADTERVMRTIKEDFIWINEFSSPEELIDGFTQWIKDYNTDYPHSSLNNMTPCEFEQHHMLHASNF